MWLDAGSLRQWMCPGNTSVADVELNPLVGDTLRIDMQTPDGTLLRHMGEYGVIEPPHLLKFTWQSSATDNRPTLVTVILHPHAGACQLTLVHDLLLSEPMAKAHERGWADILLHLTQTV
ncbi:MAG: SRPBCC domain-containing protein [Chloroflexi bacterium]|nr:SRPBCC domain-containing protein [Chloroflexota bacterium]